MIFRVLGTWCPRHYPYPFMFGEYCCKTAKEEDLTVNFDGCNGSHLSLNSVCCKNSEYLKCPGTGGCKTNRGIYNCETLILNIKLDKSNQYY